MDEAAMVRKPTAVVTTRPLCSRMLVQPYEMWDCVFSVAYGATMLVVVSCIMIVMIYIIRAPRELAIAPLITILKP